MYREEQGKVVITLSADDYDLLLMAMGYATGAAYEKDIKLWRPFIGLINRINEGNPNFKPYKV